MLKPMTIVLIGAIISVVGGLISAFGTYLQNIRSSAKTDQISDDVKIIGENDKLRIKNRFKKIQIVAKRANLFSSRGDLFYSQFIEKHDTSGLWAILQNDIYEERLSKEEIISKIKTVFLSSTMLEPMAFDLQKQPISELDFFYLQMVNIHTDINSILQQYGDIDDAVITQLDEIRGRARQIVDIISLAKMAGVPRIFEKGVPNQYADFFSHYYYAQHRYQINCKKILLRIE